MPFDADNNDNNDNNNNNDNNDNNDIVLENRVDRININDLYVHPRDDDIFLENRVDIMPLNEFNNNLNNFKKYTEKKVELIQKIGDLHHQINTEIHIKNNIINVIDLYEIFLPYVKEKHIINEIIKNKVDLDLIEKYDELEKLEDKLDEVEKCASKMIDNF